ncbi:ABC transporter family substrate-binding protein [Gardnerella swidsinskii]|uniref:ABC transporter family substrate-binding protein n=1 Tax=Gardnerella swidsinskii TaxID=2792979 RepID=UPI0036F4A063
MKKTNAGKLTVFAAAALSAAMLLGACGAKSAGSKSGVNSEPAAGVESSYTGALPMPKVDERYDNPQPRENVKDGGTYTFSLSNIGPNWNYASNDGNTAYMATLWSFYQPSISSYDTVKGEKVKYNPDYITSVKKVSDKPLVVQYNLNPKAKWNDGTDIDYTAFKATWQALSGKNKEYSVPSTEGYDCIKSVEQGSTPKQVIVTYEKPCATWELLFAPLVHPKSLDPKTFNQGWVNNPHNEWGAGPFMVKSATDEQVVFVRNPKWWGKKAKLDKVVIKRMEDVAALNAFKNGEIDSIDSVGTSDNIKAVRKVKDAQLRYGYSTKIRVLNFNSRAGALKSKAVRKAVVQAFNVKNYNKIQFLGMNWKGDQPGSELVSMFQAGYKNNLPAESKYSVANAKKTLEADGYKMGKDGYYEKGGKTLEISFTFFGDDSTQASLAKAFQSMMKEAGIKCNTVNKPASKFAKTVTSLDFQILPMAWVSTSPLSFLGSASQLYNSTSESNFAGTGNKEIDAIFAKVGKTYDYNEQISLSNKAEAMAFAEYGTIPVSAPPTYQAYKKGFANAGPSGYASVYVEDMGWQK